MLYQTSPKFRDEMRLKAGVLRSKEFLMMDLYSFDTNLKKANETFDQVDTCFSNITLDDEEFKIFRELEIPIESLEAENGLMGGSRSKEYQCCCGVGEDRVTRCSKCGYKSLYTSSTSIPKIIDYFYSDTFNQLLCDISVLRSREDFVSLVDAREDIKQLFSVFTVEKNDFSKQVVVPRGKCRF